MALTVETGAGLAAADSYVSQADTDAYFSNLGNTEWSALTTTQREEAIRRGVAWIDNEFRLRWKGKRASRTQALDWPREEVEDESGLSIADDEIPRELKHASYEAALLASKTTVDLYEPIEASNVRRIEVYKGIEREFHSANAMRAQASESTRYPIVEERLAGLLTNPPGSRINTIPLNRG